jgi:hypothetical protein
MRRSMSGYRRARPGHRLDFSTTFQPFNVSISSNLGLTRLTIKLGLYDRMIGSQQVRLRLRLRARLRPVLRQRLRLKIFRAIREGRRMWDVGCGQVQVENRCLSICFKKSRTDWRVKGTRD